MFTCQVARKSLGSLSSLRRGIQVIPASMKVVFAIHAKLSLALSSGSIFDIIQSLHIGATLDARPNTEATGRTERTS